MNKIVREGIHMEQPKRVIVGHDLGVGGKAAMRSAAVVAERCGAALRIVHVVEPLDAFQRLSHPLTSPYTLEDIVQKVSARLQALAKSPEFDHLHPEYEVRTGKPFVELIIAARASRADLIVVGGTSDSEELLGSTSERIVRKTPIPVMVAKKPLSREAKTFLIPTDFSSCSIQAAEEALVLGKCFDARLVFFHVLDSRRSLATRYAHEVGVTVQMPLPSPEEMEPEWEAFLSGLQLENVDWEKHTGEGQAANAIVGEATHRQADIIVMGTHGRSGLSHTLLGSVTEKVVRTAQCAVLTVRPDAFEFEMP